MRLYLTAGPVCEPQARPARRAGIGLGVKATIRRVFVLGAARSAHGEGRHGGERPVVRDGSDDGVARSAVGAVNEGIAIAAVPGVEQFLQALLADVTIRGDLDLVLACGARQDQKTPFTDGRQPSFAERGNDGEGGGLPFDIPEEGGEVYLEPFRFQQHSAGSVAHPAADSVPTCQPEDEGAEAYSLNDPFNFYPDPRK